MCLAQSATSVTKRQIPQQLPFSLSSPIDLQTRIEYAARLSGAFAHFRVVSLFDPTWGTSAGSSNAPSSMQTSRTIQPAACRVSAIRPQMQRPSRAFTGQPVHLRRPFSRQRPSARGMRTIVSVLEITAENFEQEVIKVCPARQHLEHMARKST